jgi:hypothetical protein
VNWYGFEILTAESPRDCPQGSIYIDEVGTYLRAQVVGGANDGHTVYATEDGAWESK